MRVGILLSVVIALALEFQGAACESRNRNTANANQPVPSANLNAANEKNMSNQQDEEMWGGDHISITFRGEGAQVEFDCAHGEFSKRLKTDADGTFDVPGTFTQESAGPTRADRMPSARSVNYRGKIEGDTMSLSITFSDNNESVGSYTLKRGKHGRIRKCM